MNKILIIDDSAVQGKMLKEILRENYQIEIEHNSHKAVEKTTDFQPDLILLDVIMPGKDGFELLKDLKEKSQTSSIPVILITSLSDTVNEEKGLSLGAVDYISKPFSPPVVKARIHTHIQLYNYRRAIERLAMIDALTCLPNRRSYDERSHQEWEFSMHNKLPISVALLDIDYFKQYNDCYGHPAGDALLRKLGTLLSSHIETSGDFAARYGGEEFVLLLSNADSKQGFLFCDSIRRDIEGLNLQNTLPSGEPCRLTVSIGGVTVIPEAAKSFEETVAVADKMLYEAKKSGKNMVKWSN